MNLPAFAFFFCNCNGSYLPPMGPLPEVGLDGRDLRTAGLFAEGTFAFLIGVKVFGTDSGSRDNFLGFSACI